MIIILRFLNYKTKSLSPNFVYIININDNDNNNKNYIANNCENNIDFKQYK